MTTKQQELAQVIPSVPFKGVPHFFDVGGLLASPKELQLCFDLFEKALDPESFDCIGCFDARGFLFAPYFGAKWGKRVFMLRKPDKMPRVSDTVQYEKEYGPDKLSIQEGAVQPGDRVLLLDDLLATGGTAEAGVKLVQKAGGKVVCCAFVVELKVLPGRKKVEDAVSDSVEIVSLLSDDEILQAQGKQ